MKKNYLFDIVKQSEKFPLLEYLDQNSIKSLSMLNKKYHILLKNYQHIKTENIIEEKTKNKKNKKNRPKKKEVLKKANEIDVQIIKIQMKKWSIQVGKNKQINQWHLINKLPFQNNFLSQKINSQIFLFYENLVTKEIIYINRSLIDPNLNYNKGGFGQDVIKDNIYQEMYEQDSDIVNYDFSSQQQMLKRQKDLLAKIQIKKQKQQKKDIINYEEQLSKAIFAKKVAIILCFGGSFSLGIFQSNKCILHKSDKKYVCRKKAGERQFNRDKQNGSSINSMGAQIRRDQQKKHIINVNHILSENRDKLQACEIIFLQAPGFNRLFVINQNQNLKGMQNKLRSVCLTAKKANYTEVQALYKKISKVHKVNIKV